MKKRLFSRLECLTDPREVPGDKVIAKMGQSWRKNDEGDMPLKERTDIHAAESAQSEDENFIFSTVEQMAAETEIHPKVLACIRRKIGKSH